MKGGNLQVPEYLDFVTIDMWTMLFTWVNMLILFLLVKKFLFKPVTAIIEKRQAEIDTMYNNANNANEKAISLEKEYNVKISQARDEAGEIIKNATVSAKKREEEILDQAREKAVSMTQKASAEIEQEKKKAYQEIKQEISEISVSIAQKMVQREINPKDHEALIAKFIENVGESK